MTSFRFLICNGFDQYVKKFKIQIFFLNDLAILDESMRTPKMSYLK